MGLTFFAQRRRMLAQMNQAKQDQTATQTVESEEVTTSESDTTSTVADALEKRSKKKG